MKAVVGKYYQSKSQALHFATKRTTKEKRHCVIGNPKDGYMVVSEEQVRACGIKVEPDKEFYQLDLFSNEK